MNAVCAVCSGNFKVNSNGHLRAHKNLQKGTDCPGSGTLIGEEISETPRKRLTRSTLLGSWRSGTLD